MDAKSSKQKTYSFKNTKNPTWKNTRITKTPAECQKKNANDVDVTNHMKPVQLLASNVTYVEN